MDGKGYALSVICVRGIYFLAMDYYRLYGAAAAVMQSYLI